MQLTITLKKEVASEAAAQAAVNIVAAKLQDQPDVKMSSTYADIKVLKPTN